MPANTTVLWGSVLVVLWWYTSPEVSVTACLSSKAALCAAPKARPAWALLQGASGSEGPALRTSRKLRPRPPQHRNSLQLGLGWVSGLRLGYGAARSPEPEAAAFAAHRADQSSFCEFCASNPSAEP